MKGDDIMDENTANGLTRDERHIVEKSSVLDPDSFNMLNDIQYTTQGNFTVCNIIGVDGTVYAGVTKRRPDDDTSEVAGHNISFVRALDRLTLINCIDGLFE